jgi:hypothetical protein
MIVSVLFARVSTPIRLHPTVPHTSQGAIKSYNCISTGHGEGNAIREDAEFHRAAGLSPCGEVECPVFFVPVLERETAEIEGPGFSDPTVTLKDPKL